MTGGFNTVSNRFNKVLLCIPPFPGEDINRQVLSVGYGYLSEVLKKEDIEHEILDMRLGYDLKYLVKKIKDYQPDLFGITSMTFRHDIVYDIINRIKEKFPKLTIVIGGSHVSTIRSRILKECRADLAVKLEGEDALVELCRGKPYAEIDGLFYRSKDGKDGGKSRDEGRIIENKDRPFLDLSRLPFPKYEKFELEKYGGRIPIVTSRGCPYNCIYCPVKLTMGRVFRSRNAKDVFRELKFWHVRGKKEFEILDDNFTLYPDRVIELCNLIKKSKMKIAISLPNGVRADRVDRKLMKLMWSVGFNQICFGVEAGNNKILRRIKKSATIEKIEEAIKNACDIGYDVELFFMVGHPDETPEDVEDSIKLALKYPISDAKFYNIVPFPNTELYDWVMENKYNLYDLNKALNTLEHFGTSPLYATPYFTKEQREKMIKKARKVQYIIKKRNLQRKMGRRFGIFGKIAATVFYMPMVNRSVKWLYSTRYGRDLMNKTVRILRLEVHHL
jgi:radical SAM superfamily enzyme YgiQ (UPF0313 family)